MFHEKKCIKVISGIPSIIILTFEILLPLWYLTWQATIHYVTLVLICIQLFTSPLVCFKMFALSSANAGKTQLVIDIFFCSSSISCEKLWAHKINSMKYQVKLRNLESTFVSNQFMCLSLHWNWFLKSFCLASVWFKFSLISDKVWNWLSCLYMKQFHYLVNYVFEVVTTVSLLKENLTFFTSPTFDI